MLRECCLAFRRCALHASHLCGILMTAPALLALIAVTIVAQLGLGILFALRERDEREMPMVAVRDAEAAWEGLRRFRVAARVLEDPSGSQCSFHLVPVDGLPLPAFKPGQFLTLVVPMPVEPVEGVADLAPERLTRCYSLSDVPRPDSYRITVKRAIAPRSSPEAAVGRVSTFLHAHAAVGTTLEVRAPSGQFVIDADSTRPLVLVAGGIGITPLLSMLTWSLAAYPDRPITLFYGVRSSADHAFSSVLANLVAAHSTFDLHVVYSEPGSADVQGRDYRHRGVITLALIASHVSDTRVPYFICGPPAMMAVIVPGLEAAGVAAADIHFEAFGPASIRRETPVTLAAASPFDVRFRDTGRTIPWDVTMHTLLDFAESNGITIAAGCRSGSCGTCETRIVEGSVTYSQAPSYTVTNGFCLPCVGVPASALVLDA